MDIQSGGMKEERLCSEHEIYGPGFLSSLPINTRLLKGNCSIFFNHNFMRESRGWGREVAGDTGGGGGRLARGGGRLGVCPQLFNCWLTCAAYDSWTAGDS